MAVIQTNLIFVFLLIVEEEDPEFWRSQARKTLQSALDRKLNTNVAKNILFFLGDGRWHWSLHQEHTADRCYATTKSYQLTEADVCVCLCVCLCASGMGITTYTAARILKGQLQNQTGEETVMTMDTFPNVGLAKVTHTLTLKPCTVDGQICRDP